MKLVPINVDSIRLGHPLPFTLRDESGVMLANKGFVVEARQTLDQMIGQRGPLCIDVSETEGHRRAYMGKLHNLVNEERALGQIAGAQMAASDLTSRRDDGGSGEADWLDLQEQTYAMLRDSNPSGFGSRLTKLQAQLDRHSSLNPDGTLCALFQLSASEVRRYSATHAMLVSVMCRIAARDVLRWPEPEVASLCNAALTMNIAMTELQDRLVLQREALSAEQRRQVEQHAAHSVDLLQRLGIADACWLEAVLHHHTKTPGPLAGRSEGQRLARLIQRADMFAARLAPRVSRAPEAPAAGMQASYFDEKGKIDEAGAALIKAVGIYYPGALVRLSTQEIAVVIRRGSTATTPRVAILINRAGMPTGELIVRDTSHPEFRIAGSVAHRDVKVKVNLERLLVLARSPASDRLW